MAVTGLFGGFYFDAEVFTDYMAELPTWNDAIINSGILVQDTSIMDRIGTQGNVATLPFYKPISAVDDPALNNDGVTDNTPSSIAGSKQTAILTQRMKAWSSQDFTKELTGADPMNHLANSVADYYKQVRTIDLMAIMDAVLSIDDLSDHVTDLTSTGTTVEDENKIDETTLIYAEQKAIGDSANKLGLLIMHSYIFARYKALGLVDYNKYTVLNALGQEVNLPSILGYIPIVSDRHTIDTSGDLTVYNTYLAGEGAFLTCDKTNYENPYYIDYDPETTAGVQKLYTKQGYVLHPNGLSIDASAISGESPTVTELGTAANWSLAYDAKNVRLGVIRSNG